MVTLDLTLIAVGCGLSFVAARSNAIAAVMLAMSAAAALAAAWFVM